MSQDIESLIEVPRHVSMLAFIHTSISTLKAPFKHLRTVLAPSYTYLLQ